MLPALTGSKMPSLAAGFPRRCRLGMAIHKNDPSWLTPAFHCAAPKQARVFQHGHECAARPIQHRHRRQRTLLNHHAPRPGRFGRIIPRAHKTRRVAKPLHDFHLIPQTIAAGDHIHTGRWNKRWCGPFKSQRRSIEIVWGWAGRRNSYRGLPRPRPMARRPSTQNPVRKKWRSGSAAAFVGGMTLTRCAGKRPMTGRQARSLLIGPVLANGYGLGLSAEQKR